MISRRQGEGEEAYYTYVEETDDAANAESALIYMELWIILPRRPYHYLANIHMRRLSEQPANAVGDSLRLQQFAHMSNSFVEIFFIVAGYFLKSAGYNTGHDQRYTHAIRANFLTQSFRDRADGEFTGTIKRAER